MSLLASQVSWAAILSRLRGRGEHIHHEAALDLADDRAFDAADVIEVGDDLLADACR